MLKNFYVPAVALSALLGVSPALSAEKCNCVTSGQSFAKVVSSTGDVTYPGNKGMEAAKSGSEIGAGNELIVGASSNAIVVAGSACSLSIAANSKMTVSKVEGDKLCLRVAELGGTDREVELKEFTFSPGTSPADLALFGLASAGTAAGGIAASQNKNTVSD